MSNKEELKAISLLIKNSKKISEVETPTMPNCEFCGKSIASTKWNKEYHHINIAQEQEKRFFCSRQCKLGWIFR
ncbi:MAG: hypothetical protein ACFFDN_37110 [Candidatus Hodarchaeota archaeon]